MEKKRKKKKERKKLEWKTCSEYCLNWGGRIAFLQI
jgi:hypothetical protein